jgi:hypothetical protein
MPSNPDLASSRFTAKALLALAVFAASGCDREQPPNTTRQIVAVKDVPENILTEAKKAVPDVKFEDAWKNVDTATKALQSYELRGRNGRGKIREVRVSTDGKILEME